MSSCCLTGFQWNGTPVGKDGKLANNNTYVTGTNKDVAILIVHDVFGWTFNNTRLVADHFAKEVDATVYIPDFFGGVVVPTDVFDKPEKREEFCVKDFIMNDNAKNIRRPEIEACAKALKNELGFKKVGAVGYCYGGWAVFHLGNKSNPLVDCISTAHPSLLTKEEINEVGVPAQILAAEHDPVFTLDMKAYANETIPKLNIGYDYQYFPGVAHGFATKCDEKGSDLEKKSLARAKNAVCEKLYESPAALERHKENHGLHCFYCSQTFNSGNKRDEHVLSAHFCKVCDWRIDGGNKCKCQLERDIPKGFKHAGKQQSPFERDTPPKPPNCGKPDFSGKEWQYRDSSAKPKGSDHKPRERQQQNRNSGPSRPGRTDNKPPPPPAATKTPIVDYYALIGIPRTATHDEILKATKKARIANHPDRFIGKNLPPKELAEVTERSKCIGQACDILESLREREIYDAQLRKEMPTKTPDRGHAQERKPTTPHQPRKERQPPPKPKPGPDGTRADTKQGPSRGFEKNRYDSDRSHWPGTPPQNPREGARRAARNDRDARMPAEFEAFDTAMKHGDHSAQFEAFDACFGSGAKSSKFGGRRSDKDPKGKNVRFDEDVEMVDVDG